MGLKKITTATTARQPNVFINDAIDLTSYTLLRFRKINRIHLFI